MPQSNYNQRTPIKLFDRYGALVGFCDVEYQCYKGLPALPKIISLPEANGRTFLLDYPGLPREQANALGLGHLSNFNLLPCYQECTFASATNFRLEIEGIDIQQSNSTQPEPSHNQHPKWEQWKTICPSCSSIHTRHKSGCREYDVTLQCSDCGAVFSLDQAFAEQLKREQAQG